MAESIREVSVQMNPHGYGGTEWANLLPAERESVQAAVRGAAWIRVKDGRLEVCEALEPPRNVDPKLEGIWTGNGTRFDSLPTLDPRTCGLMIEGVGSERMESVLTSWGFICLRCRRRADGTFYEHWHLPFPEAARGALRDAIGERNTQFEKFKSATSFLLHVGGFGRLSIITTFAALCAE